MSRPPLSRLRGGFTVGADFFARRDALIRDDRDSAPVRGLVDRMSDLSHRLIDVTRVHPAVAVFFEDPGSLDLLVHSHWRFPVSIFWRLFHWVMVLVGQFVLPLPNQPARIRVRVFAIDAALDGRADARGVIREYADTGAVMQVVAYATWENEKRRYMSATFPLPFGSVTGILRLDARDEDDDVGAIKLTSHAREFDGAKDDAGVWMRMGPFTFPAPFAEQIELWAADAKSRPSAAEIDPATLKGATVLGRHEQRFLGIRFVTHHYWFKPATS